MCFLGNQNPYNELLVSRVACFSSSGSFLPRQSSWSGCLCTLCQSCNYFLLGPADLCGGGRLRRLWGLQGQCHQSTLGIWCSLGSRSLDTWENRLLTMRILARLTTDKEPKFLLVKWSPTAWTIQEVGWICAGPPTSLESRAARTTSCPRARCDLGSRMFFL